MAFVLTKKEYTIIDKVVVKEESTKEEIFVLDIKLTDDEVIYFRKLIDNATKEIDATKEDEENIYKIIFKDKLEEAKKVIGENQMIRVMDYVIGLVASEVGLDRINTMNFATSTLRNKLKK